MFDEMPAPQRALGMKRGSRAGENPTYHIGALGALLDGLEEEAGRLAVVLLDEAPVREHRRQVVGEDAPLQRQQVAPLRRRRLEIRLLLPHRCAGRPTRPRSHA
jgi:hypothetical protein